MVILAMVDLVVGIVILYVAIVIGKQFTQDAYYDNRLLKTYHGFIIPLVIFVVCVLSPIMFASTISQLQSDLDKAGLVEYVPSVQYYKTPIEIISPVEREVIPCGNIYVNSNNFTSNVIKVYRATSSTEPIDANVRVITDSRPARCETNRTWSGKPIVEWKFVNHPGLSNYQIRYVNKTQFPQFTFREVK